MTTPPKPKRNFVISGGASHGATLWGALLPCLDRYTPAAWCGASIGAIIAAGMAVGLDRVLLESALVDLFQKNRLTGGKDLIRFHPRILWSRGGGLHDWSHVRKAIQRLFGDRRMKDVQTPLTIVVGDVYTSTPVYISSDTHPEVLIWEALVASTAIAPLADAQTIPSLGTGNRLYVDGGWGNNVPVRVFADSSAPTVVIYLTKPPQGEVTKREGVVGVLTGCLELSLFASPDLPGREDDRHIAVVPKGSGLDFDLTPQEIRRRVLDGAAQSFRQLAQLPPVPKVIP